MYSMGLLKRAQRSLNYKQFKQKKTRKMIKELMN